MYACGLHTFEGIGFECLPDQRLAAFPRRILSVPLQCRGERVVVAVFFWREFLLELRLRAHFGPHGTIGSGVLVILSGLAAHLGFAGTGPAIRHPEALLSRSCGSHHRANSHENCNPVQAKSFPKP
jgi:hypothetical protein